MSSLVKGDWNSIDSVIFYLPEYTSKNGKTMIFDLDGTLIASVRGSNPNNITNENDWIFFPGVIDKLSQQNKNILIIASYTFSEDGKYTKEKTLLRCHKILEFLLSYDIHPFFFITTKKDRYRKPERGCITLYNKIINSEYSLSPQEFSLVGDGAGRKCTIPAYCSNSSDIELAINIGCDFYNPAEFFNFNTSLSPKDNDLIILLGNPSCGKTTVANYIASEYDYYYVSDELKYEKRKSKVLELCKKNLSIVLDGSYPSKKDRIDFIEIAQRFDYSVRVLYILMDGRNYSKEVKNSEYETYSRKFQLPIDEVDDLILMV